MSSEGDLYMFAFRSVFNICRLLAVIGLKLRTIADDLEAEQIFSIVSGR